jgi:hypothetical protein
VVGRQRVGAGIGDQPGGVEPDEAVARARAGVRAAGAGRWRERPVGDHLAKVGGAAEVGDLQGARHPRRGEVGVAREDRDDRPAVADGHRLTADRYVKVPQRVLLAADPALDDRAPKLRVGGAVDPPAHAVLGMRGRRRRRPGLRDAEELPGRLGEGDPQEEVGEGHVGDELPLGHHAVQVLDRVAGQPAVLGQQLGEGRHDVDPTTSGDPGPGMEDWVPDDRWKENGMSRRARKRRDRKKSGANHGKRPNA